MLTYLILGYNTKAIIQKKMPHLNKKLYHKAVNELIDEGNITRQEIEEYRQKKEKEDKLKILEELKKGTSQNKIAEIIDTYLRKVQTYIKEIQEEENITDEDILRWRNEREDSRLKRRLAVLEGLQEGLSKNQIVKKYPRQKLSGSDVVRYRRILIEEGRITEEQIIEYRNDRLKREKEKNKLELTDFEKQVCSYLKAGYKEQEIAELTGKSVPYVYIAKAKIKEKEKITDEEIEQTRRRRGEKQEKRKQMQQFSQLKREINTEVRFDVEISEEKKEKIREYIDLCFEIYRKETISESELLFLRQAFEKVAISYEDIVKYTQMCLAIEEYTQGLSMLRSRHGRNEVTISKEKEQTLQKFENYLRKTCKLQQAMEIINRGNTNAQAISETTGLSKDEINIFKLKLFKKPIKLLNIEQREKVIELLLQDKNPKMIQEKLQISDFEMEDIEEQAIYRRINSTKRDGETQVKQDSRIRIVVLATKLGIKAPHIAKILKQTNRRRSQK